MRAKVIGLVMLLAIGMFALADMAPPGRDRPLAFLAWTAPSCVDVTTPVVAVESEVAAVARSGSGGWTIRAADLRLAGGSACPTKAQTLKRWRAWNAG